MIVYQHLVDVHLKVFYDRLSILRKEKIHASCTDRPQGVPDHVVCPATLLHVDLSLSSFVSHHYMECTVHFREAQSEAIRCEGLHK